MSRQMYVRFVFVAMAGLAGVAARAGGPTLAFDDIKTLDVAATLQPDCRAGQAPANPDETMWKAVTPHFALYLDPQSIKQLPRGGGGFRYMFYLADRRAATPAWFECDTAVFPQGKFIDGYQQVGFTISTPDLPPERKTIQAPIHSLADNDLLEFVKPAAPMKVGISRAGQLQIPLRSLVNDFPLVIASRPVIQASHGDYWSSWSAATLPSDVRLTRSGTLKIPMPPVNRMAVVMGTLTSLKPDAVHDSLGIDLSYRSALGGADRIKHIDVDVRFVPSVFSLVFALLLGSILGTAAGQTLPGAWKGRNAALKTAARSLLYSALAEAGALFLVAQGSKFVVFGAELDPLQVLSVFFIGLFTSGGKAIVQLTMKPGSEPLPEPEPKGARG